VGGKIKNGQNPTDKNKKNAQKSEKKIRHFSFSVALTIFFPSFLQSVLG
jgi:hypothetical protein